MAMAAIDSRLSHLPSQVLCPVSCFQGLIPVHLGQFFEVYYGEEYCRHLIKDLKKMKDELYEGDSEAFCEGFVIPTADLLKRLSDRNFPIKTRDGIIVHLSDPVESQHVGEMRFQVGRKNPGTLTIKFTRYFSRTEFAIKPVTLDRREENKLSFNPLVFIDDKRKEFHEFNEDGSLCRNLIVMTDSCEIRRVDVTAFFVSWIDVQAGFRRSSESSQVVPSAPSHHPNYVHSTNPNIFFPPDHIRRQSNPENSSLYPVLPPGGQSPLTPPNFNFASHPLSHGSAVVYGASAQITGQPIMGGQFYGNYNAPQQNVYQPNLRYDPNREKQVNNPKCDLHIEKIFSGTQPPFNQGFARVSQPVGLGAHNYQTGGLFTSTLQDGGLGVQGGVFKRSWSSGTTEPVEDDEYADGRSSSLEKPKIDDLRDHIDQLSISSKSSVTKTSHQEQNLSHASSTQAKASRTRVVERYAGDTQPEDDGSFSSDGKPNPDKSPARKNSKAKRSSVIDEYSSSSSGSMASVNIPSTDNIQMVAPASETKVNQSTVPFIAVCSAPTQGMFDKNFTNAKLASCLPSTFGRTTQVESYAGLDDPQARPQFVPTGRAAATRPLARGDTGIQDNNSPPPTYEDSFNHNTASHGNVSLFHLPLTVRDYETYRGQGPR